MMKTTINNTELDLKLVLDKVLNSKTGKYSPVIEGTKWTFEIMKKEVTFLQDDILFGQTKFGEEFEIDLSEINKVEESKEERTILEKFELIQNLFDLEQLITRNKITDKKDSTQIIMLDLHRMDGLTDEQYDEVEELSKKYLVESN